MSYENQSHRDPNTTPSPIEKLFKELGEAQAATFEEGRTLERCLSAISIQIDEKCRTESCPVEETRCEVESTLMNMIIAQTNIRELLVRMRENLRL